MEGGHLRNMWFRGRASCEQLGSVERAQDASALLGPSREKAQEPNRQKNPETEKKAKQEAFLKKLYMPNDSNFHLQQDAYRGRENCITPGILVVKWRKREIGQKRGERGEKLLEICLNAWTANALLEDCCPLDAKGSMLNEREGNPLPARRKSVHNSHQKLRRRAFTPTMNW